MSKLALCQRFRRKPEKKTFRTCQTTAFSLARYAVPPAYIVDNLWTTSDLDANKVPFSYPNRFPTL